MAEMGNSLQGVMGELRMTVEIKRAATGVVEKYELVGYADADQLAAHAAGEARRTRVHGSAGALVGPGSEMSTQKG